MRMDLLAWTLAVSVTLAANLCLGDDLDSAAVRATGEVKHAPLANASQQQFVIKCEIAAPDATGANKTVAAPSIVVSAGQEGTLAIQSQRPFVTGVRTTSAGESQPVTSTLTEGISGGVTVTPLDEERLLVDASFTQTNIERVDEVDADGHTTQSPQLASEGWRVIRTVKLGESILVTTNHSEASGQPGAPKAKITVEPVSADEAAITPIRTVDAAPAGDSAAEIYTVVYQALDLLSPEAQLKDAELREQIDFVPLIDMVLSEAATGWPEEAGIRAFPANGSLVVSQTREGHEAIARLLRDKRDNVAAIERLMK